MQKQIRMNCTPVKLNDLGPCCLQLELKLRGALLWARLGHFLLVYYNRMVVKGNGESLVASSYMYNTDLRASVFRVYESTSLLRIQSNPPASSVVPW